MSAYVDKLDVTQKQLRFLHKQFKEILDEKVRKALPGYSEDDEVSQEIQLQLDQFLMDAIEMAGESMNVVDAGRGTTVKSIIQEVQKEYMEPFDVDLNERVRKLYQEWEDRTVEVSQLRREAPQVVISEYTNLEKQLLDDIDAKIEAAAARRDQETGTGTETETKTETDTQDPDSSEYWSQLADQYKQALTALKSTNQDIPSHETRQKRLRTLLDLIEQEVGS